MKHLAVITSFYGSQERRKLTLEQLSKYVSENNEVILVDANKVPAKSIPNEVTYLHLPASSIYEALNYGIMHTKADYYIICGDDDILNIKLIKEGLNLGKGSDIIIGEVKSGSHVFHPLKRNFPFSHLNYISQHSVGIIVKRNLHVYTGLYDTNLKIASDAKFILEAYMQKFNFQVVDLEFGSYGDQGVSSTNKKKAYYEMACISLTYNKYLSSLYYFVRSIKEMI